MSDPEDTFDKLRRIPLDEMEELFSNVTRSISQYQWGNNVYDGRDFYPDIVLATERSVLLEINGWTMQEFYLELEKNAIRHAVNEYNKSVALPADIVDRARRVFPHATFTSPQITLE
jgi:hypothetical protein